LRPLAIKARGGTELEGGRNERGEVTVRRKKRRRRNGTAKKKIEETIGGEEAVLVEQPFHTVFFVCNGEAAT
jgi:hypothetical protein